MTKNTSTPTNPHESGNSRVVRDNEDDGDRTQTWMSGGILRGRSG